MSSESKRDEGLAEAISLNLQRIVYVTGDVVIRQGEDSEGMFFVSKGFADVLNPDGSVLTTLGRGSFFGEMSLLRKQTLALTLTFFGEMSLLCKLTLARTLTFFGEMSLLCKLTLTVTLTFFREVSFMRKHPP